MSAAHDLDAVRAGAHALMDALGREHAGQPLAALGWSFRFDRAQRRLGLCTWKRGTRLARVVSLSGPLSARLGWGVMEDVARHEIAHALDYETRGASSHDAVWRMWARRCGADPSATYDGPVPCDGSSRYLAACPACGWQRPFFRQPSRAYACPRCEAHGRVYLRLVERASGRVLRDGGQTPGPGPAARWVATCAACGARSERQRRPARRVACAACCRRHAGGRFSEAYELAFHRLG